MTLDERQNDTTLAGSAIDVQFPTRLIPPQASAYITVESVRTNPDGEIVIALRVARCPQASTIKLRLPKSQARVLYGELGKELGR